MEIADFFTLLRDLNRTVVPAMRNRLYQTPNIQKLWLSGRWYRGQIGADSIHVLVIRNAPTEMKTGTTIYDARNFLPLSN